VFNLSISLIVFRVAVCKADPSIDAHIAKQIWQGQERKREGLDAPGKRKDAMSDTVRMKCKAKEDKIFGDSTGSSAPLADSLLANMCPSKKRRVSAEHSIMVMGEDLLLAPRGIQRSHKFS
jgi:hypothetical protein